MKDRAATALQAVENELESQMAAKRTIMPSVFLWRRQGREEREINRVRHFASCTGCTRRSLVLYSLAAVSGGIYLAAWRCGAQRVSWTNKPVARRAVPGQGMGMLEDGCRMDHA